MDIQVAYQARFPKRVAAILTGKEATESEVRSQAPRHRYVHVATHGFFAPASPATRILPELRSAVVLAGVNEGGAGKDDSILTAREIGAMDLSRGEISGCTAGTTQVAFGTPWRIDDTSAFLSCGRQSPTTTCEGELPSNLEMLLNSASALPPPACLARRRTPGPASRWLATHGPKVLRFLQHFP